MRIKDIMSAAVIDIHPEADAEAAWQQMRTARVHHLVVRDNGRIAGVLTDRDLGGVHGESVRNNKRVVDLMTSYAVVAAPEMHVRDAANLMRANTLSCLPVVDGKQLVGIVTIADMLELLGRGSPASDRRYTRPIKPSTTRA